MLDNKGYEVLSVRPDNAVFDAIKKMADRDVGSVVLIDEGKPVGIFTERHYARTVSIEGRASPTTRVGDIVETRDACAWLEQTVEECMAVMTEQRIRRLPVLHHKKLVSLISIGDLVKSKIADQEFTIEQLVNYVRGWIVKPVSREQSVNRNAPRDRPAGKTAQRWPLRALRSVHRRVLASLWARRRPGVLFRRSTWNCM